MLGFRDLLLFGLTVVTASCLTIDHEAFSGKGLSYGSVTNRTLNFGKLIIGNGIADDTGETQGEHSDGNWSGEQVQFHLAETKLKRLGPSVHCGDDAMTLHVPGPRMPHFLVDRGEGSPVPVSDIPASCGISVKRVRRDVSLVAPYRGCHVRQQGGSYVLPLLLMGAPVQMSCPVSPPLPTVSCFPSGMVISLGGGAETIKIKVAGSWQPLLLSYSRCGFTLENVRGALVVTAPYTGSCLEIKDTEWHLALLYGNRQVTLSCPLTPTTAAPAAPPVLPGAPTDFVNDPQVPPMYYPFPWWHYPHGPVPTTPPTTTTTLAPADPVAQQPMFPMPMFNPYFYHRDGSAAFPPYRHYHYGGPGFHHYYPGYTMPTLPPPTTTAAQPADIPQPAPYPMFPTFPHHFHNFYGFKNHAAMTPAPTTTTTPAPVTAQPALYPGYPQMYLPPQMYYGPQPVKSQMPLDLEYPFMPRSPKSSSFAFRSGRSTH